MIRKIKAFFELFQAYKRVNNPAVWKKGQVGVDAVSGFIMAGISVYIYTTGTDVVVAGETIDHISAALIAIVPAIVGLWDGVSTVVTTNKVGFKPKALLQDKREADIPSE